MKTRIIAALVCLACPAAAQLFMAAVPPSEYEGDTFVRAGVLEITVPAGKLFRYAGVSSSVSFSVNGVHFSPYPPTGNSSSLNMPEVPGPAVIKVENYWNDVAPSFLTYRLLDNTPPEVPASLGAVVIPADATGPVDVILESSEDMVTWTPTQAGSYAATTAKRFFRVRTVRR